MHLQEFALSGVRPIPLGIVGADQMLVADLQRALERAGLLDPPADGRFGPVSQWALGEFCRAAGLPLEEGLTPAIAAALGDDLAATLFPIRPADDFAGQVIRAMQRIGYWLCRHPGCCNIVYVEGCNPDGTVNDNAPNQFNDRRLILTFGATGQPQIRQQWDATTEPGTYWTMNPMDPRGAARIAFGQFKAWSVGMHHAGSPGAHEALVQTSELTVHRDLDRDFRRAGDAVYTGMFGINQHWGYDSPKDDLRTSSAGCLVGRTRSGHREFMDIVKKDPRHTASSGYRFMTTILPGALLS